jgi:hypothetical protein
VIEGTVISTIGSVKSNLNSGLSEVVGFWCFAGSSCGVLNIGFSVGTKSNKVAESRVLDINLTIFDSERFEVLTSDLDDVTSFLRSSLWIEEGDLWVIVIPVFNNISGLLLTVKRYGEWHSSLNNIR